MIANDSPLKPRNLSIGKIAADAFTLLSFGLLVLALVGRFPISGAYSLFGVITIGSKPTTWVGLCVLLALVRIVVRHEAGYVTRLFTHPTPLRIFLMALFIYNANGRWIGAGDTIPTRLLPYSLLREGNFDLDEFRFLYAHGVPGYIIPSGRHLVSAYPPGPAILALPFYVLPVFGGIAPEPNLWAMLVDVEKLAAATLTAMSVALIYAALRRLEKRNVALTLSVIYAFGTSSLSISSQALWQHGPSQLLLAASLYCLVRGMDQPKWAAFSGLTLGWAVLCRPTDILIAIPLAAYVLHTHRKQVCLFALLTLPSVGFILLYNYWYFGSATQLGYDQGFFSGGVWKRPLLEGLAGVLLSPSRGLLIYSPVFLFSVAGIFLAWRHPGGLLYKYVSVGVVAVIAVYSKWPMWWGGWSFGPRLLADLTPMLTLLMVPACQRLAANPVLHRALWVLAALSIAVHALGAFAPGVWNPGSNPRSSRLWSWADGELVYRSRLWLHRLVGTPRPRELPSLVLLPDRTLYRRGEQLQLKVVIREADSELADLYLTIMGRDGPLHFFGPSGLATNPVPILSPVPRLRLVEQPVAIPLPDNWPAGPYKLQGWLYRATPSVSSPWGTEGLIETSNYLLVTLGE
jgi:hypothetical protein